MGPRQKSMCFIPKKKDKVLLYKVKPVSPRINLYLYSGNYVKIQFLTILLVVTCFLGGVVSVTDKEFEVHTEYIQSVILDYKKFTIIRK